MAINLPPPPSGQRVDSWQWRDWFYRLIQSVLGGITGSGSTDSVIVSPGPGLPPTWTVVRVQQAFTSQTTITVTHNFGMWPIVQVYDSTAAVIIPKSVQHISVNVFVVHFSIPVTGTIVALAL